MNALKEKLKKWTEMGINFISTGADFEYLRQSAKETFNKITRVQGKK